MQMHKLRLDVPNVEVLAQVGRVVPQDVVTEWYIAALATATVKYQTDVITDVMVDIFQERLR